ncbi:hypothetical protein DL770_004988 [Monosporascus sp. CRB-9-2]|nr:hypothetical protein DL770_004988 [Monosporascus sp. CRB-9-2]
MEKKANSEPDVAITYAPEVLAEAQGFDGPATKRLLRKLDWHLIPFMSLIYLPGVNYYITQWYRKSECGFRMALFFSAATLAGAFGGILARGIAEMHGVGGLSAWSWIFILEGLLSIIVSFTAYWAIYDYPATATFLTTKERIEVERRLDEDHGHLSNDFDVKYVWQAIKDWKIYIHMMICNAGFCPIYSFALFSPTIIRNMGYTANDAQLMSVPPYVFACFFTIAGSWFGDRYRRRGVFLLGFQVLAIVGFALLASTSNPTIQYTGLVLAASESTRKYPWASPGMAATLVEV